MDLNCHKCACFIYKQLFVTKDLYLIYAFLLNFNTPGSFICLTYVEITIDYVYLVLLWVILKAHSLLMLGLSLFLTDSSMALTATKVSSSPVVTSKATVFNSYGTFSSLSKSTEHEKLNPSSCRVDIGELHWCLLAAKVKVSSLGRRNSYGKPLCFTLPRKPAVLCFSTGTHQTETKECARPNDSSAGLRW